MRRVLLAAVMMLVVTAWAHGVPQIGTEKGLYVLENSVLRAEVKQTALDRIIYKPTGQEVVPSNWKGVTNLVVNAPRPPKGENCWLFQNSFHKHRKYDVATGESEATLTVNFDWGWVADTQTAYYTVKQQITIFADKPYLRVRYYITAQRPPEKTPTSFYIQGTGPRGTHLVEPADPLRIEKFGSAKLSGMCSDPSSYWFAYWDQSSGHFTAFLHPGQTDPTRCLFTRGQWYVARWKEPFLDQPGQSYSEELWLVAGQIQGQDSTQIAQAAKEAYEFIGKHQPILAALRSPYVNHKELLRQTAHLRADGNGEHIVFKNERLYVDGKPFLLFAPWGAIPERFPLYKKYHLTGVMGAPKHLDACAEHGLMLVTAALEWPHYRGEKLEAHINSLKGHPAALAWFLADDYGGVSPAMLDNVERIRKCETHLPTVADIIGYDADRRGASAFVDICAPYTYPAPIRTYRWYADYLDHNMKNMGRQFNWTCPQAKGYSLFAGTGQAGFFNQFPTAAQMRLQTYVGLACGIRGFMYFSGGHLINHKLSELGIVCLEVEPLTELIVEAAKVPGGVVADNDQIDVRRVDWQDHTLLFLINHRPKSQRWPTGELAPTFTVTVFGARDRSAYSMTLDEDLRLNPPRQSGDDLQVDVSGLDVAAMVLLTADQEYAQGLQQELERLRPEGAEFARTTNKYMAEKIYGILDKLGRMQAPLGRAPEFYHRAVRGIDSANTFTGQRRVARMLRAALGEALAQADALADYAPHYARNSILITVWQLPQFMASFNFRALKQAAPPQLTPPPPVEPMGGPRSEPPKPAPLEVGEVLIGAKQGDPARFVVPLDAATIYCVFQQSKSGSYLRRYADEAAYRAGWDDFVAVPNDNLHLAVTLCRPAEDMQLYLGARSARESFGVITTQPLEVGEELTGPVLSVQQPVAAYELPAAKGDSFQVTVTAAKGGTLDAKLCQVYPRYAQILASARISGGGTQSLRCTLPDDVPLVVLIERIGGSGTFTVMAQQITEQVMPEIAVEPFPGVKFALYGEDTHRFSQILADHGMDGEQLWGKLAETDLSQYEAIILLTNAIKYDEAGELHANAERLRKYVRDGGRLVVFQQNGKETWDSSILPYDMALRIAQFNGTPILADEKLFPNVDATEFGGGVVGYYPIIVAETDEHWRYLAYTDNTKQEALLAACDYGRGRAIINQFAVLDRIGEQVMRSLMMQTVRYVLEGD